MCYRFVKTMSDDAGRIPLHVGVICFHMCGKLQCQLILEHHCEKSLHARQPHWCIPRETAATVTISHLAWKELMHFWLKREPMHFWAWRENQCILRPWNNIQRWLFDSLLACTHTHSICTHYTSTDNDPSWPYIPYNDNLQMMVKYSE